MTLTLNPAIDRTVVVQRPLQLGHAHQVESETVTPGGKGINVAKALAARGEDVACGGLLGSDRSSFFVDFLHELGIGAEFLTVPQATRCNLMVTDGAGHEVKINETGFPDLHPDWEELMGYWARLTRDRAVVVMSGSLPVRFPPDTYRRLLAALPDTAATVLDTSAAPLSAALSSRPDIIKPNRDELAEALGVRLQRREDIAAAARGISENHEVVIVSNGADGAYFAQSRRVHHAAAPEVAEVDTTGAGDALLGEFCSAYFGSGNRALEPRMMARAVAAGAAAVELPGTPVVPPKRVDELAGLVEVSEV